MPNVRCYQNIFYDITRVVNIAGVKNLFITQGLIKYFRLEQLLIHFIASTPQIYRYICIFENHNIFFDTQVYNVMYGKIKSTYGLYNVSFQGLYWSGLTYENVKSIHILNIKSPDFIIQVYRISIGQECELELQPISKMGFIMQIFMISFGQT